MDENAMLLHVSIIIACSKKQITFVSISTLAWYSPVGFDSCLKHGIQTILWRRNTELETLCTHFIPELSFLRQETQAITLWQLGLSSGLV